MMMVVNDSSVLAPLPLHLPKDGGHQIMMTVITVIPQCWRLRNHYFPKGWGIMTRPR